MDRLLAGQRLRRLCFAAVYLPILLALSPAPGLAESDVASSAEEVRPILIGTTVPAVELRRLDGTALDLLEAVKQKPTIIVFYRGGW